MVQPKFNPAIQQILNVASFLPRESTLETQLKTLNQALSPDLKINYARFGISPALHAQLQSKLVASTYIPSFTHIAKINSAVARYGVSDSITEQMFAHVLAGVRSGELDIDENEFDYSEVAPEIEDAIETVAESDDAGEGTVEQKRKAARLAVTFTLQWLLCALYIAIPELKNIVETARTSKDHAESI
ncbi:hypothetical protein [Brevibacterium sp. FAM 24630]|uniref:hypothetical protein n=1 Tax=Brevibacterium sp. FAM 24630 TaxID=3415680 RepID=UPI003C7ACA2F